MPKPAELSEALQYNYLLFLVPFVFYAFGWAFHIILELKHKYKFVFLGALITITFVVDFLIAHLPDDARREYLADERGAYRFVYTPYDWRLNGL